MVCTRSRRRTSRPCCRSGPGPGVALRSLAMPPTMTFGKEHTVREVLLFSAGLDSFPAWHFLGKPPALYFDSGHYGRQQEIDTVRALAAAHGMDLEISAELDLSARATKQGD